MRILVVMGGILLLASCGKTAAPVRTGLDVEPLQIDEKTVVGECKPLGEALETGIVTGQKRFVVRVERTAHTAVRVVLGPKQIDIPEASEAMAACATVDVPFGDHELTVRAHGHTGEGAGVIVHVSEYAESDHGRAWWYDTAAFQCGSPSACDKTTLVEWKRTTDALPRHLHDPCGSTRVQKAEWAAGRATDEAQPDDFAARMVLKVYDFAPKAGPGQCKAAGGPGRDTVDTAD